MASLAFTKLLSLGLFLLLISLLSGQLTQQPRYMTSGRTVEKTLPLALLIVYPSPGNVYPQAYGVHVTNQRQAHGVYVTIHETNIISVIF
jgi:hypothetical protein